MPYLTEDEQEFFDTNGYVKLSNVIPEANCEAVIDAIWEFTGKRPDDRDSWYAPPEGMDDYWDHQGGGMIEMYHHQTMWDNRQHPGLYQAFAEVLGREDLNVSIDRVNMTPPVREDTPELDNSFIHWDTDTSDLPERPVHQGGTERVPHGVQGVLYLDDTSEKQGGFQAVPSLYRELDEWIAEQPEGRDPRNPDFDPDEYEVEAIAGEQGDLLIWDSLLPHGNGHNEADRPRFAQYISMMPTRWSDTEWRDTRVESWREREPPETGSMPGDPREREKRHAVADLTPLGRKLLGVDPWSGWLDAQ